MRVFSVVLFLIPILAGGCNDSQPGSASHNTGQQAADGARRLVCYVSTNMRASMEELAQLHEARTGVKVSLEVADARTLIAKIEASRAADIFVCHDPFLAMLMGKDIELKGAWTVASVKPMIAVPKGNPKRIGGLEDLARPGLRAGLTDANNSISGHIVTLMLKKAGVAEKVQANVVQRTLQGWDIANSLVAGDIDACIVWNAVIFGLRDRLEAVDIRQEWRPTFGVDAIVNSPTMGRLELDYVRVTIATLSCSKSPTEAKAFAEFVASPEGAAVFTKNGFSPADPSRPALPKE